MTITTVAIASDLSLHVWITNMTDHIPAEMDL